MLAGTLCGLFMQDCLQCLPSWYFFAAVPFQNLWHVPVAACMVAEPRLQMMYPFVTFWWLEQWRYLFACAGGACGTAWDRCGCYCRSAVVFTEQVIFRLRYWVFFLWGHICLPMCRWEMCGILSGNYLIPQYCMQPAEAGLWKMICACRLQEMNLPCYSAVERLRSA